MGAEGGLVTSLEDLLEGGMLSKLVHEGVVADTLTKLIEQSGRLVLEPRADGSSLLQRFTLLGCYEAVKVLWDNGAKPSVLKSDDSTLVHSAVRTTDSSQDEQRSRILSIFLSDKRYNIPINHRNAKGWTALKLAARKGLERCVEILLDNGADPSIADEEDYIALHNAVGNHAIVKLLVSHLHNIDAQTQNGETSLYLAVERGNNDCALTLLEHRANPNICNKEGISPLFLAARGGNIDLVRVLLRHGANVNSVGAAQQIAPLHWAAHKEHSDIAMLLIEFGANVQLKDKEGRTPLCLASPELASRMLTYAKQRDPQLTCASLTTQPAISAEEKAVTACCNGNVQALQALLNSGIDINHTNEGTTLTLLHMGAYSGQVGVVALLLNNGANWQLRDKDGDTVLHFACMKEVPQGNHDATLQFLLSTPAINLLNSQNCRGDTPLLVSIRCQYISRAQILLQHKVDTLIRNNKNELPLHRACSSDQNIGIVLQLCEKVLDLDTQDNDGWTPLMYAARSQSFVIVHYLLQKGVDPNLQQSAGFTALHLAAQENLPHMCKLLLQYKSNPNSVGGAQELTPLHIAAHKSFKDVCRVLIEYGADSTLRDKDGDTPLTLAEDEAVKHLIQNTQSLVRDRSNSNPNSASFFHNFCKHKSVDENDEDKICSLNDTIMLKDQLLEKILEKLKYLRSENELLQSRLKARDEEDQEIALKMAQLRISNEDGDETITRERAWWLIGDHELKISEEQLNVSTLPFQRFFDVYKGVYRSMDVAVKKLNRNQNWEACTRKTFLREVEQLSRLQCSNIVQFIGASLAESQNLYCLVFEYIPYNLYQVIHEEKIEMSLVQQMFIVRDIASGMAYLHTFPILHKNLLPRNILIGKKLNAKISDFGFYETKVQTNFYADLRKRCLKEACTLRPVYKAPEAIEKNTFTTASDVYSFSMVVYEIATGKKPFSDMDPCGNAMVWFMRVLMGTRPEIPHYFDQKCKDMIALCWHSNPSMRPSFKEFLAHCNAQINKVLSETEENDTATKE